MIYIALNRHSQGYFIYIKLIKEIKQSKIETEAYHFIFFLTMEKYNYIKHFCQLFFTAYIILNRKEYNEKAYVQNWI